MKIEYSPDEKVICEWEYGRGGASRMHCNLLLTDKRLIETKSSSNRTTVNTFLLKDIDGVTVKKVNSNLKKTIITALTLVLTQVFLYVLDILFGELLGGVLYAITFFIYLIFIGKFMMAAKNQLVLVINGRYRAATVINMSNRRRKSEKPIRIKVNKSIARDITECVSDRIFSMKLEKTEGNTFKIGAATENVTAEVRDA